MKYLLTVDLLVVFGTSFLQLLSFFSLIIMPVTHFFATKMGRKGIFDQIVKASFYPNIPAYLFGRIPILGILGTIWALYSFYLRFKVLHKMNLKTSIKFSLIFFFFYRVIDWLSATSIFCCHCLFDL